MCDKKTSSIVHSQQAPVERVAELMTTAETELAAFYEVVFRQYGSKEARRAAQDWIEELETMERPAAWALPNWRHVTIAAADCLASRIIDHSPTR
jgi:predicted LPLAT superfamily acyltransferase